MALMIRLSKHGTVSSLLLSWYSKHSIISYCISCTAVGFSSGQRSGKGQCHIISRSYYIKVTVCQWHILQYHMMPKSYYVKVILCQCQSMWSNSLRHIKSIKSHKSLSDFCPNFFKTLLPRTRNHSVKGRVVSKRDA